MALFTRESVSRRVFLSSSGWIRIGSFRDEIDFGNGLFSKMGKTINMKHRYRYYIDLKFFHLHVYIHLYIHTLGIFEMKIWIYDTRVFVYLSQVPDEFELGYYVNESCLLQQKTAIVSIFRDIKSSKIVRFCLRLELFWRTDVLTMILTSKNWNRNSSTTDNLKIFAEIQKLKHSSDFHLKYSTIYKSKKRKSQR